MLRWIIGMSMRIRLIVVSIAVLLIIFGVTQLRKVPVDVLPEFSRPYVEIQTEALGLSATEVEAFITTPMEADMLNGVSWVDEILSESIPGLSSIVLIFEPGTDMMAARQMVQERLVSIYALPNVSKAPTMLNPMSSTSRCMMIGLTSEELSLIEMSVLARWTIVPRLLGVPGVANVSIWGFRDRQLQVQVDPNQLRNKGVTLSQIISTTGNALWVSPLSFLNASTPGTGGFFDTPNQRLGIRHILPITNAEELAKVSVEGSALTLGDVSQVVEDHQPLIGGATIDESPNLMLIVEKFPWANTLEVTGKVESALTGLRPGLSGLNMNSTLFRPATFIEVGVANLTQTLIIGAILVILALLAFFINWRSALVSIMAVLLSAIVAVGILYFQGITPNMMIIAGMIIALGAIIDDAIVDIENIKRRIRQHREQGSEKSVASIIFEASVEMRTPIIYATMIIVLAVVPVFFLHGLTGAFYQPVAASYLLALLASFGVALTVTPALSSLLFRKSLLRGGNSPAAKLITPLYDIIFLKVARTPRPVFVAVCIIVVAGIVASVFLRQESLIPTFKETDLMVHWEAIPGTSHPEMNRILSLVSKELGTISGVRGVSGLQGRAIMSDRITNVNNGELWVNIDPKVDYDATVKAVQDVVDGYPGFSREVLTYMQSKVRQELSGTKESFVVRVYGEDMGIIKGKAEEVQKMLAKIEGIVDSRVHYQQIEPSLEIEVNLEAVKQYGLKPGDVRRQAASLVAGIGVGYLFEEQKVFDVVVWGKPETRHSLTSLYNLLIETPTGVQVPLKEVADIRIVPDVTNIKREAVARCIDVSANVNGRDLNSVVTEVRNGINGINFALEYRAELLGEYAERMDAQQRLMSFVIAAAILIFLLLQAAFRSWKLATAVFLTLPMALVGGIAFNYLAYGSLLSLGSIIGFVTVFGITVRNCITLIRRFRNLEKDNGEAFGPALVERGTRERFIPVVMTAVTVFLAFLPMALFGNIAGLEIVNSMAVVILGGLITSTLYTLLAAPAIYLLFGASHEEELDFGHVIPAI